MPHTISIIGAGSAVFSLAIVRDLCLTPNLHGSRVILMDVDQGRLDAIQRLAVRYAQELGIELELHTSTERRTALLGADIVVNAALAAGHHRLLAGWEVARRLGYRWGGSLHVMHDEAYWINFYQLKLFTALIDDMLEVCPAAWYIQIANPVQAGITYLSRRYPQARMVGLCHGFGAVYQIADLLGLEREHVTFEAPGVNHFIWLTKLFYKGQDAMPLLDRWIAEHAEQHWRSGRMGELNPKKCDLYRRVGAFPLGDTAGDGGGSWGWWYHVDAAAEQRWKQNPAGFWERFVSGGEREVAAIKRIADDTATRVSDHVPPVKSGETIVPLIEALLCDTERVVVCNVANRGGYVPGVPHDFQVEVPALVGRRGIQPVATDGLPPAALAYLLRDCVVPTNLELDAFMAGSRKLLIELLMLDPWTTSEDQASALIDGIAALPFHAELRDHFR